MNKFCISILSLLFLLGVNNVGFAQSSSAVTVRGLSATSLPAAVIAAAIAAAAATTAAAITATPTSYTSPSTSAATTWPWLSTLTAAVAVASNTIVKADTNEHTCSTDGYLAGKTPMIAGCIAWKANRDRQTIWENDGNYKTFKYNSIPDLIKDFELDELQNTLPGFSRTTPYAIGHLYWKGVGIKTNITYIGGQAVLIYEYVLDGTKYAATIYEDLPTAAQLKSMTPQQRKAVEAQESQTTEEYFKSAAGAKWLSGLMRASVADAPYDPIAGNPASMMAQYVKNDYNLVERVQIGPQTSGIGIMSTGLNMTSYQLGSQVARVYLVPIDYTRMLDNNDALLVDVPLGMTSYGKADSYNVGVGVAWQHNFFPSWSITPALHVGVGGSAALASGTILYDGSVTSRFTNSLTTKHFSFGLTDNVSYLKTGGITVDDYSASYDMDNLITRNGIDGTYYFQSSPMSMSLYVANTSAVSGQTWYISNYNEVGFKTSTFKFRPLYSKKMGFVFNRFTSGFAYIFGPHGLSGIAANLSFNF